MADETSRKQLHFLTKIPQRQGENGANDYSKTGNNTRFFAKTSKKCEISMPDRLTIISKNSTNNDSSKGEIFYFFRRKPEFIPSGCRKGTCSPSFFTDFDTVFLHFSNLIFLRFHIRP